MNASEKGIPLESVIVKAIMAWIRAQKYPFVYKTHGSAYQRSGIPDITLVARGGRYVGLEVKRPQVGRLTAIQAATLNAINRGGGYATVVTSVDEAMAALTSAEAGEKGREDYRAP